MCLHIINSSRKKKCSYILYVYIYSIFCNCIEINGWIVLYKPSKIVNLELKKSSVNKKSISAIPKKKTDY